MSSRNELSPVAVDAEVPTAASVVVQADATARDRFAARWVADSLREVVARQGHAVLALVGGSSVAGVHLALRDEPIDWHDVTITLGDERAVPVDSTERNWRVIAPLVDTLEADGRLPADNVVVLGDLPEDPDPAEVERVLARVRDRIDRIDVALLGLGPDGHVASLFPHHPGLASTGTFTVITQSPKPPPLRVSATVGMLAGADAIALLGFGAGKAAAVKAVTTTGPLDARPGRLVHLARRGVVITDRLPDA